MTTIKFKTKKSEPPADGPQRLADELRKWIEEEGSDWDELVKGGKAPKIGNDNDLYDDMPVIDSKAVARSSPIFERNLGIKLDTKLIRPGGYSSPEEMINHLVPLMEKLAKEKLDKEKGGKPNE